MVFVNFKNFTQKKIDQSTPLARGELLSVRRYIVHAVSNHREIVATLRRAEPPVWRKLVVADDIDLITLHRILQIAFQWEDAHLWEFQFHGDSYTPEADDYRSTQPASISLAGALGRARKGEYTYDFGDSWILDLSIKKVSAPDVLFAHLSEGEMRGPLEDVGGIPSHNDLVSSILVGKPPSEDLRDWLPTGYDPKQLNVEIVNSLLDRLAGATDEMPDFDEDDEDDDDEFMSEGASEMTGLSEPPLDSAGEPIMYDPNDTRGPDPQRWGRLVPLERIASVAVYHQNHSQIPGGTSLHAVLHTHVETALMEDLLKDGNKLLERLTKKSWRRHEIIHLLMAVFATTMGHEGECSEEIFDAALRAYVKKITIAAATAWREGGNLPPYPVKKKVPLRLVPPA